MHINPLILTCPLYFALKQSVEASAFLFKEIFNLFNDSFTPSQVKLDHSVTVPVSVSPSVQNVSALGQSALVTNMRSTVGSFYSDRENSKFSDWLHAYQRYAVTSNQYVNLIDSVPGDFLELPEIKQFLSLHYESLAEVHGHCVDLLAKELDDEDPVVLEEFLSSYSHIMLKNCEVFANQFADFLKDHVKTYSWLKMGSCYGQFLTIVERLFSHPEESIVKFINNPVEHVKVLKYQLSNYIESELCKQFQTRFYNEPLFFKEFKIVSGDQVEENYGKILETLLARVSTEYIIKGLLPQQVKFVRNMYDTDLTNFKEMINAIDEGSELTCHKIAVELNKNSSVQGGHVLTVSINQTANEFVLYDSVLGGFSFPDKITLINATFNLIEIIYEIIYVDSFFIDS